MTVNSPSSNRTSRFRTGRASASKKLRPRIARPLRGLKVTFRVVEHDSKQVREVTVVHEFVPL